MSISPLPTSCSPSWPAMRCSRWRIIDDVQRLLGEANADGPPVVRRTLMLKVAHFGQLLDVVGTVRALIIATLDEIADGDLLLADIRDEQRLDAVDVANAQAIQFSAEQIEKPAMQPLDQPRQFEVFLLHCRGSLQRASCAVASRTPQIRKGCVKSVDAPRRGRWRRLSRRARCPIRLSPCR